MASKNQKVKRYDIGGYYNLLRDSQIDSTQSLNAYQSVDPVTKKKTIVTASGHSLVQALVASFSHRAALVRDDLGLAFVVVGNEVIQLDTFFGETVIGTIGSTTGYAGMSANQLQICIVDGTGGWIWNTATLVFSKIAFGGPLFPQAPPGEDFFPADVTNINGYFMAVDTPTVANGFSVKWRISKLNNGINWATLDFVNFLSPGDRLVGIRALHKRAFIFGNLTTEVWYNGVGTADFPFLEDTSLLFEHGLAAVGSLKESFELMFYISRDISGTSGVQMISGTVPRPISTPAMNLALQEMTAVSEGQAILYKENGLIFYQISFTTDKRTFVYVFPDTVPRYVGTWHELRTLDGNRHVAATQFFFNNMHFIGSYLDTKLFQLSYKFLTYDGDLIAVKLIGPLLETEAHKRIRIDRLEVVMVTGLLPVPVVDPADLPTLMLSLSRDGGKTFGSVRRESVGNTAEYDARPIFRNLGVLRGRDIIPKLEFHNNLTLYITGIVLTYEVLSQ